MNLIVLTWKGINYFTSGYLDFSGLLFFFPHAKEKVLCVHSEVSRWSIPGCSSKRWAWNKKQNQKQINFDLFILTGCWHISWICVFLSRIRFFDYMDWSVEVGPQKVTRKCQFLLCVVWKRRLQFRHPVHLSAKQESHHCELQFTVQ